MVVNHFKKTNNKNMKKLKVCIIGAGKISEIHISVLKKNPHVEITSICDINVERAKEKAKRYNIVNVFDTWEKLFEYNNFDVVDIVLPNYLHSKVIIESLKRNKFVICEKPLSVSLKELKDIKKAIANSKGKVFLKQYLRFSKLHKYAKELIYKNKIGRIYLATGHFVSDMREHLTNKKNWRSHKDLAGGGILMEIGVHFIDYVNSLFGKPLCVTGFIKGEPVENLASFTIKYKNNIVTIICDGSSTSLNNWWTKGFYGTFGHIIITDNAKKGAVLEFFNKKGKKETITEPNWWEYANEQALNDIIERIVKGKSPLISINEAEDTINTILEIYDSAKQNKAIEL